MRWPLLLVVLGCLVALLPVGLGLPDLPSLASIVPMVAGVLWAWLLWSKEGKRRPLWAAIALSLVVGGYAAWFLGFSSYAEQKGVPAEGSLAPGIEAVRVRDGARFQLSAQRGGSIVLVFFRGHW